MRTAHRTLIFALGIVALTTVWSHAAIDARQPMRTGQSTPVIMTVVPAAPAPARDPQMLQITGKDFQPRLKLIITTPGGGTIELKDDAIQQLRDSSFQASALLATAGKYSLVVTNPDGGVSAPFVLEARAVVKLPTPIIQRIMPEGLTKNAEAQNLTVEGQNFGPGLHVTVTDPLGVEVPDPVVRDATTSSFKLSVKLENAGPYNLVVSNASGAVSNVAVFTVK